ncbi:MAG: YdcF family protein [Methylobacterium mesophilicum]|nr:YdcF family protein [Methylobacterium mesophilicum]
MTTLPDSAAPHAVLRRQTRKPGGAVRKLVLLGVASVVLMVAGFAAFSLYVSNLATPRDVAQADAIIVLTGGQARLEPALELLKAGKGTRLLISGVHPKTGPKTLSAATGNDRRLFNCCVDFDYAALDTTGNAEQSAIWVENHKYRSVILVTNNYHMPRTMLEMGRLIGDDAELRPYPVVNTKLDLGRVISEPQAFRVMFTEYAKYVAALARSAWPTRHATPDTATAMLERPEKAR